MCKAMLQRNEITSTSKMFYLALKHFLIPNRASHEEIGKALGVSSKSVANAVHQLEAEGYITVDRMTYRKHFYNLVEGPTSRLEQEEMEAYRKEVTASPEAAIEALRRIGLLPKN